MQAGRDVDIADRVVGALPYLVPLFDGLKYGELDQFSGDTLHAAECR